MKTTSLNLVDRYSVIIGTMYLVGSFSSLDRSNPKQLHGLPLNQSYSFKVLFTDSSSLDGYANDRLQLGRRLCDITGSIAWDDSDKPIKEVFICPNSGGGN